MYLLMYELMVLMFYIPVRGVEIQCPICLTWSHFIQDELEILI